MLRILIVGIGGFIGAIMRFGVAGIMQRITGVSWPIGTFTVNILGCFIVGCVAQQAEVRQWFTFEMRLLVITGFLGSFTTFSALGYDSVSLVQQGRTLPALLFVVLQFVLGFGAVWLGQLVAGR